MLRLTVFGSPQITWNDQPVTGFVSSKAQALLYYLAITGRPHSRSALAGLFWGDMTESDARMNLRHVLANLRQLVGGHLGITRESVAFQHNTPYWLDVEQFHAQLQHNSATQPTTAVEHLRQAVALYRGDLLEGLYVREAPAFEEWMLAHRERLRQLMLNALHEITAHLTAHGDHAVAIDYVTQSLTLEPLREESHRQLMTLLNQSGQRDAALLQYRTCTRVLDDAFGAEPEPATTVLFEQIKQATPPTLRTTHWPQTTHTERRPLTVLAREIDGLLAFAEQLDADDQAEVIRAYTQVCKQVTDRFRTKLDRAQRRGGTDVVRLNATPRGSRAMRDKSRCA